jgi:fibronectin type 3 domain-containing protein
MKSRAEWLRSGFPTSATIFLVAASALLTACGASSGPEESTQAPPPPTHNVQLSWEASQSPDISGYNIYRAPYSDFCGTFLKINPALDTGTAYTDSTVTNGTSYCYATTAVNTDNAESGFSNVVSNIEIPAN